MLGKPEPACLLIADISGYTSFLAGAELDHAQDVLADLVGTVVASLRPAFRLAKLEGDAAFAYQLTESLDAAATQDAVERCYFTFRRRLRDIGQASSCDCNSCNLVPTLDLKLVLHHGPVVRQRIAGHDELVGSSVVVVHRLLKNHVVDGGGPRAYALYTDATLAAMGVDDPAAAGLTRHAEGFEGVGEIVGWVRDLEAAWQAELERGRTLIGAAEAERVYSATIGAPPPVVWDWVTSPGRRLQWQYGVTGIDEETGAAGRRGVGTVTHCVHGPTAILEEVLDWRPYDYVTYRSQFPIPGLQPLVDTFTFADDGAGGTRLELRIAKPRTAKQRALAEPLLPGLDESMNQGFATLQAAVAADMATRAAIAAAADPEPALPASEGRNVREPIAKSA